MPRPLTADELLWVEWFEALPLDLQQRYVAHQPFVEGAKRERARIREELEEWLIGRIDPRDAGLYNSRRIVDEIDRICPREP